MPRNDLSDSLSVRGDDDPRKPLEAIEQETELELGASEAKDTGGVEHQSRADREGVARDRRPEERETSLREPERGPAVAGAAPDAPDGDEHP